MKSGRVLAIADDLSLPVSIASQAVCLVGIRGAGKTNTGGAIAEELLDHQQPIVVIDPTDAWWGLRASRDGHGHGYPVYVFGGPHGDIDLLETAGKEIAEFVASTRVSVVLSLRHLRKGAQRRFVTEFAEELYHLKGRPEYRTPLTVFIDEAPLFVPQKVMGEHARTVGAVEDLIARGRNVGFGVVLISQRLATVNKDVVTQCDTMICHRLPSPQDRKAVAEWFEENASVGDLKAMLGSLPTLENGDAWVWSPRLGVFTRTHIRLRRTFDSSASPDQGTPKPPQVITPVDLDALRAKLAQTVERAKADDPKELKQQLATVREQLAKAQATSATPVLTHDDWQRLDALERDIRAIGAHVAASEERLLNKVADLVEAARAGAAATAAGARSDIDNMLDRKGIRDLLEKWSAARTTVRPVAPSRPNAGQKPAPIRQPVENVSLGKCERAILTVLANQPDGCEVGRLTLLAGYRYTGGFRNSLGALRQAGYIAGENTGVLQITDAGHLAVGPVDPLPDGPDRARYWLQHPSFGKCERAILAALLGHPRGLTADQLCRATGYEFSGGFRNALGSLRTAGVLLGRNTEVMRASDDLF